jgi:hypothetical protein
MREIGIAQRGFETPRLEDWVVPTNGVGDALRRKLK